LRCGQGRATQVSYMKRRGAQGRNLAEMAATIYRTKEREREMESDVERDSKADSGIPMWMLAADLL